MKVSGQLSRLMILSQTLQHDEAASSPATVLRNVLVKTQTHASEVVFNYIMIICKLIYKVVYIIVNLSHLCG